MSVESIYYENTTAGMRAAIRMLSDQLKARDRRPASAVFGSCGCPACNETVSRGHFACSTSSDEALAAEAAGMIAREFANESWEWRWTSPEQDGPQFLVWDGSSDPNGYYRQDGTLWTITGGQGATIFYGDLEAAVALANRLTMGGQHAIVCARNFAAQESWVPVI